MREMIESLRSQSALVEAQEVFLTDSEALLSRLQDELGAIEATNDLTHKREVIMRYLQEISTETRRIGPRTIDADVFVPGHGEICGKDYLDEQGAFIQEWLDLVQGAINRGMTKEVAVEELSLLDRYPMDIEIDFMGPMVMKWNVNRLWDVLTDR